jgi:MoxR-like ATPase
MEDWKIFHGNRTPHDGIKRLPDPPPWRPRRAVAGLRDAPPEITAATLARGSTFQCDADIVEVVNAALYLRRPLLVTGAPGSGKSSLIDAVAYELQLGEPLRWPVTSRSTLQQAQYTYDAVGRLQARGIDGAGEAPYIGDYVTLGPLGTALLPTARPRALLIDEIDKSDIDLPNDLLNVFEEGHFMIPELARDQAPEVQVRLFNDQRKVSIPKGQIACWEFPFVVLTSNGEREFPAPFLRRCLRLTMPDPTKNKPRLADIVRAHLGEAKAAAADTLIANFATDALAKTLATDQLLNAVYLVTGEHAIPHAERDALVRKLTEALGPVK